MDIQKIASTGTAIAVVGTGTFVGGGHIIDQQTGGPEKRAKAQESELRLIIREEVQKAIWDSWPETTGNVKGLPTPQNYKNQIPQK